MTSVVFNKQKMEISKLKPLTGGCVYNPNKWMIQFKGTRFLKCISEFDYKKITRITVIRAYSLYFQKQSHGNFNKALLLTMIWGFDKTGYGPHRTYNYIVLQENRDQIISGLSSMKAGNVSDAFQSLKAIKGLGTSYISKILYFAGRALKMNQYPLIFDIRVARSMISIFSDGKLDGLFKVLPSDQYSAYEKYKSI